MEFFKRLTMCIVLCGSAIAVCLLSVAFGTKHWVVASAARSVSISTTPWSTRLTSGIDDAGQFSGKINFGLFQGFKDLNNGIGSRPKAIWMVCLPAEDVCMLSEEETAAKRREQIKQEYYKTNQDSVNQADDTNDLSRKGFISFKLWLMAVIVLSSAIVCGILAVGFSVLNIIKVPIATMAGVVGLYVWNGVAATLTFACVVIWAIHFHLEFKQNVMNPTDITKYQWSSNDGASFGFSYWILIGALLIFLANVLVLFVSYAESKNPRRTTTIIKEKPVDGIIMLY